MGDRRFVNIRLEGTRQEVNVEMPGTEKLRELIPDLVKVLAPPQYLGRFEGVGYQLFYEEKLLTDDKSLIEQDINNSETLILSMVELTSSDDGNDVLDDLPQYQKLAYQHIPVDNPSLVSISPLGWVFVIGMTPFTIGRPDRDFIPDMDLTEIDTRVRSSRRHTDLIMKNNHLAIVAHKTTNGTFVNGRELIPEKPVKLRSNDKIQFGRRGVKFAFRVPSKQKTK